MIILTWLGPSYICPDMSPSERHHYSDAILLHHLEILLDTREHPKTICPSEVARALRPDELDELGVSTWRELMPEIRGMCWTLRDRGHLEILQWGNVLPANTRLETIKGPIRIRKCFREESEA